LERTIGYLRLIRPANIVTAIADILAGIAISGFFTSFTFNEAKVFPVLLLCLSTIGLYGGGIVFNDVFDAKLDAAERPERPIPSGLITIGEASLLGGLLLIGGIITAALVSNISGILALSVALAALLYNKYGKHHSFFGPLNMGICRGLNLLLGISIIAAALNEWFFLAAVPVMYIFAITMISRGEVHGGNRKSLYIAAVLYIIVLGLILYISIINKQLLLTLLFLLSLAGMIFRPLLYAIREPIGKNIGMAVKAGVISLIIMDAAWAAAFNSFSTAAIIILLLPVSLWLAKVFAVT
jgi:hypothetical protein